jgi:hypothetical protein
MITKARDARFTFAGIGTRGATAREIGTIIEVCASLSALGGWCYSGNADGCDIACQTGAGKQSTAWIPWPRFNFQVYDAEALCGDVVDAGEGKRGRKYAEEAFPNLASAKQGVQKIMTRNAYQVIGDKSHPRVAFVLCCADPDPVRIVAGGTGQAVRIATALKIPVFNLRSRKNFTDEMMKLVRRLCKRA